MTAPQLHASFHSSIESYTRLDQHLTDAGAVRIRGVNKSDALVHHPPEQRDRRALILNSLCFGGAFPPFKLSYKLVKIATRSMPFWRDKGWLR